MSTHVPGIQLLYRLFAWFCIGIGGNSYDYESNIDDGYNILLSKIM